MNCGPRDKCSRPRLRLRNCVYACCFVISGALAAQAPFNQHAAKDDRIQSNWVQSYSIAPLVSWITTTQNQTNLGGSVLTSWVDTRGYCDKKTSQIGIVGAASDSNTSSPGSPSTLVVSNDVRADWLGLGSLLSKDKDDPETGHYGTTQNYFSAYADAFINNSLGIGLQQEYVFSYERYLRKCSSVESVTPALKEETPRRFFPSVTVGLGYVDQRLYKTTARMNSAAVPISAQLTYIYRNSGHPPNTFISVQTGYTPMPNDMHAYQAFVNGTWSVPSPWKNITLTVGELDVYMNNAPTGFKRNYQSGSAQLSFAWSYSTKNRLKTSSQNFPGACYTADTLNHLYCYDQVAASECSPPSIFRPDARCSEPR